MEVVIIPFDYEKLSSSEQARIIPICIKYTDDNGNEIDWGWFEAASSIQDALRDLARAFLNDVWRVSEITEGAVHSVWKTHGHHLGFRPSQRIYVTARWLARDLKAGCWQSRRGVLLGLDELEEVILRRVVVDPVNYGRVYENELFFKQLGEELENEGQHEVSRALKLLRAGKRWAEVGEEVGVNPDAARMRFRRWIDRLLPRLSARGRAEHA